VIVYVGHALAYTLSRKQKCISKSQTKAELIALMDNVSLVELFREFVEFLVMRKISVLIVYKDCNAVVSLVTFGGGVTRTKHLCARMHLGKEMVDEGRIRVIYNKGEDMLVDGIRSQLLNFKIKQHVSNLKLCFVQEVASCVTLALLFFILKT
jgi:hypothetical protein